MVIGFGCSSQSGGIIILVLPEIYTKTMIVESSIMIVKNNQEKKNTYCFMKCHLIPDVYFV